MKREEHLDRWAKFIEVLGRDGKVYHAARIARVTPAGGHKRRAKVPEFAAAWDAAEAKAKAALDALAEAEEAARYVRRKRPKFPDTDSPEIDPDDPPFPTGPLWTPLAGPQTEAFNSPADIVFYGGAAGGGKSDLLIGLALLAHRRSIIFRREYGQIQSLEDRSREIIGRAGRYNTVRRGWRMKSGQVLEFGAVPWEGQERKFQGRAQDLVALDELTHFTEARFRFLCAWNRTTEPGERVRVVAAGNPPVSQDGEWIMQFWAP